MFFRVPKIIAYLSLFCSCNDFSKNEEKKEEKKEEIAQEIKKNDLPETKAPKKESGKQENNFFSNLTDIFKLDLTKKEKKIEEKSTVPKKTDAKTKTLEEKNPSNEEEKETIETVIVITDRDSDGIEDKKDECPDDVRYSKKSVFYEDKDEDGHGDLGLDGVSVCSSPREMEKKNYSQIQDDECPTSPKTFMNDSDCDGFQDNEELCPYESTRKEPAIWYIDKDGDGLGDIDGKQFVFCKNPSGKKGYNYYLTASDYCPKNQKLNAQGSDCGSAEDDAYEYPVKGQLGESDLTILRERILLSLKKEDNIVGKKNSVLFLSQEKNDHMIMNTLGVFNMRLGEHDEAIKNIEKAITLTKDDFYKAYYSMNLSEAFKKKKEEDKAKEQVLYVAGLAEKNEEIKGLLEGRIGTDFLRTYKQQKKKFFSYEVALDISAMYDSNIGLNENIDSNILKTYQNQRELEGYTFPLKVSGDFVFSLKDKKDLRFSKYFAFNYNENKVFTSFNNIDFGLMGIYTYKEGTNKVFVLTNLIHGFYSYNKESDYKLSLMENQLTPSVEYKFDNKNTLSGSVAVAYGNYKEITKIPDKEKDYVSITPTVSYGYSFGTNEVRGDVFFANKIAAGIEHRSNTYGFKPRINFNNLFNMFNFQVSSKLARSVYSERDVERIDQNYNVAFSLNKNFFLSHNQRIYSDVTFFYEKNKSLGYTAVQNYYDYGKKTIKLSMRYSYE